MKMRNPIAILSVVFAPCAAHAQELVSAREHTDLAGIDPAWSENWNVLLDSGEVLSFAPPPIDSDLMKSFLAYYSWQSQRTPIGVKLQGAGFETLQDSSISSDFDRGLQVYEGYCAACHGANDEDLEQADADGWVFPPLWGPNSFIWGAGMHQTDEAPAFIKKNMPVGLTNLLTDQQAWDVAAYVNSQERPQDPRFNGDIQETAKAYHNTPYDVYGSTVNGVILGADAYPSGQDLFSTSRD